MGKKKSSAKPTSSTSSIAQLFLQMQNKSSQWYDKEREGISLIEGFQTALNACRDEMAMDTRSTNGDDKVLTSLTRLGGNTQMDPLLVEDLFAQVKELKQDFDKLLHEMYDLHLAARTIGTDARTRGASRASCHNCAHIGCARCSVDIR